MKSTVRRVFLETLGWVLVGVGFACLFLPGPGLLGIVAGLALLSEQYDWAERHLEPIKVKALRGARESVESWPRIVASLAVATFFVLLGLLWIWSPPPPAWWGFDERWWLPGGWGAGLTQVGSGLFAIGFIAYSFRRFRTNAVDASP